LITDDSDERWAPPGDKTIKASAIFWTDHIAKSKGEIKQKHGRGLGVVRIQGNHVHKITPGKPIPFNSLMDLTAKIEKLLIQHGIEIRRNGQMRRYMPKEDK